jgi:hypothetical protein
MIPSDSIEAVPALIAPGAMRFAFIAAMFWLYLKKGPEDQGCAALGLGLDRHMR